MEIHIWKCLGVIFRSAKPLPNVSNYSKAQCEKRLHFTRHFGCVQNEMVCCFQPSRVHCIPSSSFQKISKWHGFFFHLLSEELQKRLECFRQYLQLSLCVFCKSRNQPKAFSAASPFWINFCTDTRETYYFPCWRANQTTTNFNFACMLTHFEHTLFLCQFHLEITFLSRARRLKGC